MIDENGNKVKQRVVMFTNKEKNNEKSPDFVIYLSVEQNTDGGNSAPRESAKTFVKKTKQPVVADDDEIPEM